MPKYSCGVTSISMGAIAGDGGMGTTLADVGEILAGSASLEFAEPQVNDFFSEQSDDPIYTKVQNGVKELKFSVVDMTPAQAVLFLGGTASGTTPAFKYESPDTAPVLEKSFSIVTPDGITLNIVRGRVYSKLTWSLDKTKISQIDVTVKVLKPTKAATKAVDYVLS